MDNNVARYISTNIRAPDGTITVLSSFGEINDCLLGGKYYCKKLAVAQNDDERRSERLLHLLSDMLQQHGKAAVMDVFAAMCSLRVPAYHLTLVMPHPSDPSLAISQLMDRALARFAVTRDTSHNSVVFAAFKRSAESNNCYRHHHHIARLVQIVTRQFTRTCELVHPPPPTASPQKSDDGTDDCTFSDQFMFTEIQHLVWTRIKSLLIALWPNHTPCELGGTGLVLAVLNAYLLLHKVAPVVPFDYMIVEKKGKQRDAEKCVIVPVSNKNMDMDSLKWFLGGKYPCCSEITYAPSYKYDDYHHGNGDKRDKELHSKMGVIEKYDTERVVIHSNVTVIHLKSKAHQRQGYGVPGKPLVCTLVKQKTSACSSYKSITPDECLATDNSLNFNINGNDQVARVTFLMVTQHNHTLRLDRMEPIRTSHVRMSSNSFQHGLLNLYSYRWSLMAKLPMWYYKVQSFPAVTGKLGLLHREGVLFNKGENEWKVTTMKRHIKSVAEIDQDLENILYSIECGHGELLDNHAIGMVKILHAYGKHTAAARVCQTLSFDRQLIAVNTKTSRAEVCDTSKFDTDGKGKASKRIKSFMPGKNRQGFLEKMNSRYKDVAINVRDTNSRGKWNYLDRLNHMTDLVFYSDFTAEFVEILKRKYKDCAPITIATLDMMSAEINQ